MIVIWIDIVAFYLDFIVTLIESSGISKNMCEMWQKILK